LPGLERLRLSSLDCIEVDETLVRLIAEQPRLMPHLHLSLQAGDDMILKRMKRRHARHDAIAFCERVRRLRPDVVFGADLIVGFPTETAAMFERSLSLLDACGITYVHVFPFSPRPGTPAARMPQLDGTIVQERAQRLRMEGDHRLHQFLRGEVGRTRRVLVENSGRGHTQHFAPVVFDRHPPVGSVADALITGATFHSLEARIAA
jgi:threonylcarbamoyladenosine tRNA methylthiotransferase MtaB